MFDSETLSLLYDYLVYFFWLAFFIAFGVVAGIRFGNWFLKDIKQLPSEIKEYISHIKSRRKSKD